MDSSLSHDGNVYAAGLGNNLFQIIDDDGISDTGVQIRPHTISVNETGDIYGVNFENQLVRNQEVLTTLGTPISEPPPMSMEEYSWNYEEDPAPNDDLVRVDETFPTATAVHNDVIYVATKRANNIRCNSDDVCVYENRSAAIDKYDRAGNHVGTLYELKSDNIEVSVHHLLVDDDQLVFSDSVDETKLRWMTFDGELTREQAMPGGILAIATTDPVRLVPEPSTPWALIAIVLLRRRFRYNG